VPTSVLVITQSNAYRRASGSCSCHRDSRREGARMQAKMQVQHKARIGQSMCHTALISTLMFSPFIAAAAPAHEVSQMSSSPDGQVGLNCPEYTGLRKNICYGPCCGIPWGPGGPICLALSAGAFRTGMPYRLSSWLQSKEEEAAEVGPVDKPVLAFSAALFLSSAPLTFGGVALSWLLLVLCLV
jgi:hypothetical protein